METQVKKIREQFTVAELKENYIKAVKTINEVVAKNDFRIHTGVEDGARVKLDTIIPDFNNLSKNARKNVAKRFHFVDKKKSRKTINTLLFVLRKLEVIKEKVSIDLGYKEKDIQRLRSIWKIMDRKTEEARLAYKELKGDFYKKEGV